MKSLVSRLRLLAMVLSISPAFAPGQETTTALPAELATASHIVIPQTRSFDLHGRGRAVAIEQMRANVRIIDETATTTLDIQLRNQSGARAEAILLLPVPDDAAVSGFMFEGSASEPTARIMRREEARRMYDSIVARVRDPALLEFAGYNLVRTSVFPIESGATQRVRLTYENVLETDGDRVDYVLPRSESLSVSVPFELELELRSASPVSMVYSPTHDLQVDRRSPSRLTVHVASTSAKDPGPFRLSYLRERDDLTASLFAYPDPKIGGGYFLLIAGLPANLDVKDQAIHREVTLVIDRSGSMAGGKLEQVRDAALHIIEGLEAGEAFNIIDYATTVESFSPRPVVRSAETLRDAEKYLDSLRPMGGTNIHDALVEALRQPPTEGALPIVLFLTDGLPTVGVTRESSIREMVTRGNEHERRIFTFGVGVDVNAPLLDCIAEVTRATSAYVLPDGEVETEITGMAEKLYGPVLASLELQTFDNAGGETTKRVTNLMPPKLPDLFEDDQLVLLGQYREDEPIEFILSGSYLGERRRFRFEFDFDRATTKHAFVPRLWASRRIAYLVDQIRQATADSGLSLAGSNSLPWDDPRFTELTEEILRLSTEFGVLSEYTSFLATEGTDLGDWESLRIACGNELNMKAAQTRWGAGAVNQAQNVQTLKGQAKLNYTNAWTNAQFEQVETTAVQQICDQAFFNRGGKWIDSKLVANQQSLEADEIIEFGSERHFELIRRLVEQNRQGVLSLPGEILIQIDDRNVLVRNTSR